MCSIQQRQHEIDYTVTFNVLERLLWSVLLILTTAVTWRLACCHFARTIGEKGNRLLAGISTACSILLYTYNACTVVCTHAPMDLPRSSSTLHTTRLLQNFKENAENYFVLRTNLLMRNNIAESFSRKRGIFEKRYRRLFCILRGFIPVILRGQTECIEDAKICIWEIQSRHM